MNDRRSRSPMQANRSMWDERATIHLRDAQGFYAVDRFRSGEDVLYQLIASEIGDVGGKRLAHLQCHIGLETLCLARRGAIVTGLDFSAAAVAGAQSLAAETGLAAGFVQGDVYDAPRLLHGEFDIVLVSWGSLNWLPDIWRWGNVVAALLAPGGYLYLVEQHPFIATMQEVDGQLVASYGWRTPPENPTVTEKSSSYSGDTAALEHTLLYEWDHPLSDIIGALLAAGLRLDFFHEHEVLPWQRLDMMVPAPGRQFRLPKTQAPQPLSFSLKASKPSV